MDEQKFTPQEPKPESPSNAHVSPSEPEQQTPAAEATVSSPAPDAVLAAEAGKTEKKRLRLFPFFIGGAVLILAALAVLAFLFLRPTQSDRSYDLFSDGLILVQRNGKYGYADRNGKEVIPCTYYSASNFRNGIAMVQEEEDGNFYYINTKNERAINTPFYSAGDFDSYGCAVVERYEGNPELIDTAGKTMCNADLLLAIFDNGYYLFGERHNDSMLFGIVNTKGNIVIPATYNSLTFLFEADRLAFSDRYLVAQTNTKSGTFSSLITVDGKELYSSEIGGSILAFSSSDSDLISFSKKGTEVDTYGFIDKKGSVVISPIYEEPSVFCSGITKVTATGMDMVIDEKGNVIYSEKNHSVEETSADGYAVIKYNGKYGVCDSKGNLIIPCEYDKFQWLESGMGNLFDAKGNTVVTKDDQAMLINRKGETVSSGSYSTIVYSTAGNEKSGLCLAINEKTGVSVCLDAGGEIVFTFDKAAAPDFDDLFLFSIPISGDGYIVVYDSENDTYGVVDKTGKTVIPVIYDSIEPAWN